MNKPPDKAIARCPICKRTWQGEGPVYGNAAIRTAQAHANLTGHKVELEVHHKAVPIKVTA